MQKLLHRVTVKLVSGKWFTGSIFAGLLSRFSNMQNVYQ